MVMTTVGLLEGSTEALYDNEAELRRLIGERLVLLGAAAEPASPSARTLDGAAAPCRPRRPQSQPVCAAVSLPSPQPPVRQL